MGNLPSGSEAEISIRMVGQLPIEADGQLRFTLPSVLSHTILQKDPAAIQ